MIIQCTDRSAGFSRVKNPYPSGRGGWRGILGPLLIITIAGCSQDSKETLITEENQTELYQTISKGNALTHEEGKLLEAYLERHREELEERKLPPGRTIEKLIQEKRLLAILDQSHSEDSSPPSQDPNAFESGGKGSQPKAGKREVQPSSSPSSDKSGGDNLAAVDGKDKSVLPEPEEVESPAPTTAVIPSGAVPRSV